MRPPARPGDRRRAAGWGSPPRRPRRRRPRTPASSVIRMACAASSCSACASRSTATRRGSLSAIGQHHDLRRAGDPVDPDPAEHLPLGLGDIGVARPDDPVHRPRCVVGPPGQRRDRLRAADPVDFLDPGPPRGGQHQRVEHAVGARDAHRDPPHAGDTRRAARSSAPRKDRPPCRPARTSRPHRAPSSASRASGPPRRSCADRREAGPGGTPRCGARRGRARRASSAGMPATAASISSPAIRSRSGVSASRSNRAVYSHSAASPRARTSAMIAATARSTCSVVSRASASSASKAAREAGIGGREPLSRAAAARKRSIQPPIASGRVLSAVRLTMSRLVMLAITSVSTRPFAFRVEPVCTRSTISRDSPSPGASSIAPLRPTTSAWTPRAAKCRRAMVGYLVATRTRDQRVGSSEPAVSTRLGDRDAADADAEVERGVDFRVVELHQHVGAANADLRRAERHEGRDVERPHPHHVELRVVGREAQPAAVLVGVVGGGMHARRGPAARRTPPRMRPFGSAMMSGPVASGSRAAAL